MWVLHGISNDLTSNPKVRREVDKVPVADVPVVGEITMKIDSKEVIAKKVQKRTTKKMVVTLMIIHIPSMVLRRI